MTETKTMEDFKDRPYQQAIIDVCINRNSIVYLPTGSGKSYIAIQVIGHFGDQLERKYSEGGKRAVFLVNTVYLAKQQGESITSMLPYSVGLLSREQDIKYSERRSWDHLLEKHQILVATPQIFLDAIKHSYIKLEQISVIVFDECHHGRKDHPYHEIMKQFPQNSTGDVRIVGLSGMLIGNDKKTRPHTVSDDLVRLEATFQSTVITVNKMEDYKNVLMCSTNAEEGCVTFVPTPTPPCITGITNMLEGFQEMLKQVTFENYQTINPKSLLLTTPRKVKDLELMFNDFKFQVDQMGAYGGYLSLLSILIQLELVKRWCDTEKYREVVKACITITERCINRLEFDLGLGRDDPMVILQNSSHKVRRLVSFLRQKFNDPNREKDLQCLVFVQRRSTAKAIYHLLKALKTYDPSFPIEPDFMVGVKNELPESIEAIVSTTYYSITLEKFKNKETNCIVSSSVLEEGIDLQNCNLVIMFDKPATYRSYVQTRGRARVQNSCYAVLVEEESAEKFREYVEVWRSVDKELKTQLLMKTLDREPPTEENILKEREEAWEPFFTSAGSVLNNVNSISFLHNYSMKMPSDLFTNISIFWRRIENDDGTFSAAVQLPSESTVKDEIISDPQKNVKLAKQNAAFKACVALYQHGELNEFLVPIDDKEKIEKYHHEYFSHWEDYKDDKKTAGKRNHRRYHKIKTPIVLQNSAPRVKETNFLYRIIVRPKFEKHKEEEFAELLSNERGFGILTSKRIPRLCIIRLFQSYGEMEVEIATLPIAVNLKSGDDLKVLQNFHVAIFRDVLKTWENYFALDKMSYLIVPLTEDATIDFALAREFQSVEQPRRLSFDEIKEMKFTRSAYYNRVINPVYRDTDQNYVVIAVHENMSPLTPFPNDEYASYKEYIGIRFGIPICKADQPMLEVKGIKKDLNLLFQGAGMTGKKRKREKEHLTEHYIPELCHNYRFPADYWLKATLLPSICNRLHFLLLAEQLRMWLIEEGIDSGAGPQVYKLDVDYQSYDQREAKSLEQETAEHLENFQEILKQHRENAKENPALDEARHSRALLLRDRSQLPIDIDRNWLSVTEEDIDYYCNFLNQNQNKISPASTFRLQQLNGLPPRPDRLLMDVDDRSDISIIHLDGRFQSVQQKDLIKVLTTSNAGDVFDMERLEVLGDGFLKFICSLYLYKEYENWHEGYLTSLKGRLVSNRNLFYIGDKLGLPSMIKSSAFKGKESLPASIVLPTNAQILLEEDKTLLTKLVNIDALSNDEIISGQMEVVKLESLRKPSVSEPYENDEEYNVEKSMLVYIKQHYIGDKVVADAVKAFLGVVIKSLGVQAGLKMCQKLKVLPPEKNLTTLLSEKIETRMTFKNSTREVKVHNRSALEEILAYNFTEPKYLCQALTHASYPIKPMGSYQQLEFLGDAVLDFLVTAYITEHCPEMDPGKLTDLRSALVNNVTLACIVVRNGIQKFLLAENCLLAEAIKKFVDYQASREHSVVLDQIILLDTESDATSAASVDVPKVIGDLFESIIGAVFLDSGLSLSTTWKVIYGLLKDEIQEFSQRVPNQIVRMLFEYERGSVEPKFFKTEVVDEETVAVPVEVMVRGERKIFLGYGKNRSVAKKCAAKLALKALKELVS